MDKEKRKNVCMLIVLIVWIVFIISVNIIVNIKMNRYEEQDINNNLIDIKMITEKVIVQGEIATYEIINVDKINKDNCLVNVMNSKNVVIDKAYIRENRIIVDTSPLSEGEYKINIIIDENQMISSECFSVIVVKS